MAVIATVQSVRVVRRQQLADARAAQTQQVAAFQASMLLGSDAERLGRTMVDALRTQMTSGLSSLLHLIVTREPTERISATSSASRGAR